MRIMVGACLMITALELDRSNLRMLDLICLSCALGL